MQTEVAEKSRYGHGYGTTQSKGLGAGLAATMRRSRPSDAGALATLINRAYDVDGVLVDGQPATAADVADLEGRGDFLVIEEHGGLAAAVYLESAGQDAHIKMVSVSPEHRGRGLGTRLVAVAEAMSTALGCHRVALRVVQRRPELTSWSRRLGYQSGDDGVSALGSFANMTKALGFAGLPV